MYLKQEYNGIISLITWDWKEDPNWPDVLDAIDRVRQAGYKPKIFEIDTQSDESAIMVGYDTIPMDEIQKFYEDRDNFFSWG